MALRFGDIRLLAANYAASFRFYRDLLGLPLHWGDESGGYAQFKLDGLTLALLPRGEMEPVLGVSVEQSGGCAVLSFAVDDVDAAYAELVSRGALPAAPPQDREDWGYRVAHLWDPDRNLIELYHEIISRG